MPDLIEKYFPSLTKDQREKLALFEALVKEWNAKINVISRKDTDHLFIHHILHSLALLRFVKLPGGINVLDVGTGGGFPGIPLAIAFPGTNFKLIDGRNKKILVAGEIVKSLDLPNVDVQIARSEELKMKFDVVLGRAVASFPEFLLMTQNNLDDVSFPESGVYYWTGGNAKDFRLPGCKIYRLDRVFEDEYFKNKFIIHRANNLKG